MRHLLFQFLIITAILSFTSCSSEEKPEEQLIGSWSGQILEDDYGFFKADVIFSKVSIEETIVLISYSANDKSQCDNDIYFCDEPSEACTTTWSYQGFSGGTYRFIEQPNDDVCAPGMITLRLQSENELTYQFVGIEEFVDVTAAGVLSKE